MDSKYNLIENGGRDTPSINGFGIKRKFSNGTAAHHNGANKKQCDGKDTHFAGNFSNGNSNGHSPRQPVLSIADQRRNLPVFQVRKR